MANIITWAIIIIGAIMVIISTLTFKRKGEAELSENVTETVLFRLGVVVSVIGLIAKVVVMLI